MTNIYFIIADTTKRNTDKNQMDFLVRPALNDLSGILQDIADRNKTPIDKMRLYICPDKKTWMKMQDDFRERTQIL
jgi:hypothetical protein